MATMRFGRYDPRLFDAVVEWCLLNGKWINAARLLRIAKRLGAHDNQALAALAGLLLEADKSPKWKRLSLPQERAPHAEPLPFFHEITGMSMAFVGPADPIFLQHGFLRSPYRRRDTASRVSLDNRAALRIRMRGFFGVTSRADIISYLLAIGRDHAAAIARQSHYAQPPVARVLTELALAGVISEFRTGREVEYEIDRIKWLDFLGLLERPIWTDWVSVYVALAKIHADLQRHSNQNMSSSLLGAELRRLAEGVNILLREAGVGQQMPEADPRELESYPELFEAAVGQLLETLRFRSQKQQLATSYSNVSDRFGDAVTYASDGLRTRSQLVRPGQTLRQIAFHPEAVAADSVEVWPRESLLSKLREARTVYRGNPFPLVVRKDIEYVPDGLLHLHEDIDGSFGTRIDYWYIARSGIFYFAEIPWEDTYGVRVGGQQFANGIGVNSTVELLWAGMNLALRLYRETNIRTFHLSFSLSDVTGRHLVVDDPRRAPFHEEYVCRSPDVSAARAVDREASEEQLRELAVSMAIDIFWAFGWSAPRASLNQVILALQESWRRVARESS